MKAVNKCIFTGNLTRDPEIKIIKDNVKVVRFGLAVNRRFKRANGDWENEPAFLELEAWDSGAQSIVDRFVKGDPILVECSVKMEQWEKDGEKRSALRFRVNHYEKLARMSKNNETE
jgi:single-strand DNA-binding protein